MKAPPALKKGGLESSRGATAPAKGKKKLEEGEENVNCPERSLGGVYFPDKDMTHFLKKKGR